MDYEQVLTSSISDDAFCGENLEDDSGFQNFFFEAQGTPERFDGQKTNPAEPPDWRAIKKQGLEYLTKTKDLKLVSVLAQAVLNTEGLVKFETCLSGIATLLEEQWDTVYPPLDEDDGDPLERISALGYLSDTFITMPLKTTPLAASKGIGKATLQSIDKAVNGAPDSTLSIAQIKGIFGEVDQQELIDIFTAVNKSISHLTNISQVFIANAGHEYAVNLDAPLDVFRQLASALEKYANVKAEVEEEAVEDSADDDTSSTKNTKGASAMPRGSFDSNGEIGSRQEVEKCFTLILNYYKQYEPSSPIPILINRANKLVHLDFLEIIKDIYPDALTTLHQLGGIDNTSSNTESDSSSSDDSW